MTLAELGAKLREERVSLGLTVEDVAMRLKIPARILRAIDDGEAAELPHTVYTRGFIKGYGLILGYSGDAMTEMIDSLEDFSEDFSPPKTLEAQTDMDGQPIGKRQGFGLVLKLLVVALLCAGGYAYYTHTYRDGGLPQLADFVTGSSEQAPPAKPADNSSKPAPSPAPAAPAAAPATPAAPWTPPASTPAASPSLPTSSSVETAMAQPAAQTPAAPSTSAPTTSAPANSAPSGAPFTSPVTITPPASLQPSTVPNTQRSEADPVKPSGLQTLPASSTPPPAESPVSASDTSSVQLPAGMHQMVLTAEAECWVHANADGTDTRQFSLKAGETFAMPFKKSMVLKLGNAGGVKIKYDGVELPPQGSSGQVKTITLPPKG